MKNLNTIPKDTNFSSPEKEIWQGTEFWIEEIARAGVSKELAFFNDVITEKAPPHPESGYHLVLSDILLDNKRCDLYHTDQEENGEKIKDHTFHRLFIHIKE